MQQRALGATGLHPSVLGFGCSRIASLATTSTAAEIAATLRAAFDAGVTFYDTADVYGQGDSERLLGQLFRQDRERVLFCTKAGLGVGPLASVVRLLKPVLQPLVRRSRTGRVGTVAVRQRSERHCIEPGYLRQRIEGSLRRLRTDRVDLFLLHSPPVDDGHRAAALDLLRRLREQGKLRWFGVSCQTIGDAASWLAEPGVACLQLPLDRTGVDAADTILRAAAARGVGVIAREVFAGGALLQRHDAAQAIAPLLARTEIGVLLAGMTSRTHLRANLAAIGAPAA